MEGKGKFIGDEEESDGSDCVEESEDHQWNITEEAAFEGSASVDKEGVGDEGNVDHQPNHSIRSTDYAKISQLTVDNDVGVACPAISTPEIEVACDEPSCGKDDVAPVQQMILEAHKVVEGTSPSGGGCGGGKT